MRIHIGHLSEFVGARYVVPQDPISDAAAAGMGFLGYFVDGRYSVPQNPILDAGMGALADFVAANYALLENPVVLDAGVGDMVGTSAMYPIPINSVLMEARAGGLQGLHGDCGCGCGGSCGGGMGDLSTFFSTQWANIQAGNWTTIALWGGGALVLAYLLFGRHGKAGSAYRQAKSSLRKKYSEELRSLKGEFPSAAGRVRRAAAAF